MEMVWLVKSTVFSSRMLKYSPFPPPMMMWSRQGIPRIFPASITLRVVVISSCDGVGSPDGCECRSKKELALERMPDFRMFGIDAMDWLISPMLTMLKLMA